MNDAYIRQIVQEELRKSGAGNRFGLNSIPYHTHNGTDSNSFNADNLIPGVSISGNITFSQQTIYTLNLNASFTPSSIIAYGNVVGSGNERYVTFGSASLGTSFFFQPLTNTSVQTGTVQYPTFDKTIGAIVPLQSSVYFGAESSGGNIHTLSSEGHIVRVAYGNPLTVFASATVTSFSKTAVLIDVDTLATGWSMNVNYVIS